jgi:hypothetical protein
VSINLRTYNKHRENKIVQRKSLEVSINRRRSETVFSLQYVLYVAGRLKFKARPWGRLRDPIQAPSKCTSTLYSLPCLVTRIYLPNLRKINSRNLVVMKPPLTVLFFRNPKSGCAHFGFLLFTFVSRKCYLKMITWDYYPCYTRGWMAAFKFRRRHVLQIDSGPPACYRIKMWCQS